MGAGVGDTVGGETVGRALVGELVGDMVGVDETGESVGDTVGSDDIGATLGGSVGCDEVGDLLGDMVGELVGAEAVGAAESVLQIRDVMFSTRVPSSSKASIGKTFTLLPAMEWSSCKFEAPTPIAKMVTPAARSSAAVTPGSNPVVSSPSVMTTSTRGTEAFSGRAPFSKLSISSRIS